MALADANIADVISSSLGATENAAGDYSSQETILVQFAAQGQTFLVAQGDSGSDDNDFGVSGPGTSGLTVDYPGSSQFALSVGGTDFQDVYDVRLGSSIPQSPIGVPRTRHIMATLLAMSPKPSGAAVVPTPSLRWTRFMEPVSALRLIVPLVKIPMLRAVAVAVSASSSLNLPGKLVFPV